MKTLATVVLTCAIALSAISCRSATTSPPGTTTSDPYAGGGDVTHGFQWPTGRRVAVSLTFDDARYSQVDVGIPLLDRYGVRATFYVSPDRMAERLDDWKAALAAGHEVGNHSMRHPCTGNFSWAREKALETYTLAEMAEELDAASAFIEKSLGVRPVSFAYPCGQTYVGRGQNVESYVPVVARKFLTGRGWLGEGPNDPAFCDFAQLLGMELDGLTFEQLEALVDDAAGKHAWLVLCGHDIGPEGRQTTRIDTLGAFCEYAQDPANGVWVAPVEEIARYVAAHRTPLD